MRSGSETDGTRVPLMSPDRGTSISVSRSSRCCDPGKTSAFPERSKSCEYLYTYNCDEERERCSNLSADAFMAVSTTGVSGPAGRVRRRASASYCRIDTSSQCKTKETMSLQMHAKQNLHLPAIEYISTNNVINVKPTNRPANSIGRLLRCSRNKVKIVVSGDGNA